MMTTMQPIDASRWARLKDHVADLASLGQTARVAHLDHLSLSEEDRDWLRRLAEPMLTDDRRLSGSHPSARATVEREKLRWRCGETIGDYQIESLLGRGGMGEVYEARSIKSGRLVALKILRAGLDQADYAKFSDNEQRALRRLDDPRIAKFVEAFSVDGVGTCLVLEWVDGEPMQSYCRDRRYDVAARLKLFVEVCQAVASAHQQLVIHRDLKPSNVLVTPDGSIKLLDFGVSKLLDDDVTQTHTQTHGNLFTLDYAAPEQVLHEPVSTATDVYALGGLLFRLLTDTSPYLRAEGASLIKAVLEESPQKLSQASLRSRSQGGIPPKGMLDPDLDRVVRRAMDKDPKSRYRSVLELAGDVEAILSGRPISSGGSPLYRLSKFVRRHRASAAGSMIAILALISAGVFSLHEVRLTALHAHRADVANRFLLTALDLTDRYSTNNRGEFTLGEVLERAVTTARTELADEPNVRATVLGQLATALKHVRNTELAKSALDEAYEIRKSDPDATDLEKGEVVQNLASIEIDLGQIDAAGVHLHEALDWLESTPVEDPVRIAVLTSLGKLASMRGDADESLRWYEKILPIREALPDDHRAEIAMDYNNLGTGLFNLSRFRESDAAYSRGIALLESKFGNKHPRLGYVQVSRAACLIQLGRFGEADALLNLARSSLGQEAGAGSGQFGSEKFQYWFSTIDYYASDYAAAIGRAEFALAQLRKSSPIEVPGILTLLARADLASGQAKSGEGTLAEAEQLYVANDRGAHIQRWVTHGLHGVALSAIGNTIEGDKELEFALTQIAKARANPGRELAELTLLNGAAQRRRGEIAEALRSHRQVQVWQQRMGWLGELGVTLVNAELVLDGASPGADTEAREFSRKQLEPTVDALRKLAPRNPLLSALLPLVKPASEQ
jgi:eukaryotic-like serine/threonine-protein kinase